MTQIEELLFSSLNEALSNLHTATIAKVTKVNTKTINCKPVFKRVVDDQEIDLPEFAEVPVVMLQGGSSAIKMPISVGDYALVIFTERAFDGWWSGKDNAAPTEYRMHDYSDGIAIVGINPGGIDIPALIEILGDLTSDSNIDASTYSVGGTSGVSGSFLSNDGKTITVTNGIITNIV